MKSRAAALLLGAAALLSCSRPNPPDARAPVTTSSTIEQVLASHTPTLMALPEVVGTGIASCNGEPCIRVLVRQRSAELDRRLPRELEGFKVDVQEVGEIRPR